MYSYAQAAQGLTACRHDYNGINVISHSTVDTAQHSVHAASAKPAGLPQGRIKPAAAERAPDKVSQMMVQLALLLSRLFPGMSEHSPDAGAL